MSIYLLRGKSSWQQRGDPVVGVWQRGCIYGLFIGLGGSQIGSVYTNSVRRPSRAGFSDQVGQTLGSPSLLPIPLVTDSFCREVSPSRWKESVSTFRLLSQVSGHWLPSQVGSLFPISVCSRAPFTPTSVRMPHSGQNDGENKLVM